MTNIIGGCYMLESLFGTSTIEKILFYLLQNKNCYPSELKRNFNGSLYVYQRALDKLESGGVLISYRKGKTLIYEFNPRYPFYDELILFLEKAYSFLPSTIKEKYYEPIIRKRPRRHGKPL